MNTEGRQEQTSPQETGYTSSGCADNVISFAAYAARRENVRQPVSRFYFIIEDNLVRLAACEVIDLNEYRRQGASS